MEDYIITTSSTADLPKEYFVKKDLKFVKYHFELDGKEYLDDLGDSISSKEFYEKIKEGCNTRTSLVNEEEYIKFFEELLESKKNIIHIELSSGISGSYNSAKNAAERLNQINENKIKVIDSLAASSGLGLLVDSALDLKKQGKSFDEVVDFLENNKLNLHHWFFSTNLERYFKGGRISKTSFMLGSFLNIYPLLNVSKEGKLVVRKKLHGIKAVRKEILNMLYENIQDKENYSGKIFICHSDFLEEACHLAKIIEEKFPKIKEEIKINNIGPTIGSHSGVGTFAVFFYGTKRED